jgi:hypothetical protein
MGAHNSGSPERSLTVERVDVVTPASPSVKAKRQPLWLVIEEMMSDVSDEEMARVPPANSRAIDRKLYGSKAKDTRAAK